METKGERSTASKIIDIVMSAIFLPVALIMLVCSVLMYNAKQHNEVPSLFNMSAVVILSNSMDGLGFNKGDYVMVKRESTEELEVGDIIAFYEYFNDARSLEDEEHTSNQNQDIPEDNSGTNVISFFGGGASNYDQETAAAAGSRVIFHRIVAYRFGVDAEGVRHRYFATQGDNEQPVDTLSNGQVRYIKDTMVVGVYDEGKEGLAKVFSFGGSVVGIIILVLIPALILVYLLSHSLIEQLAVIRAEKRENEKEIDKIKASGESDFKKEKPKKEKLENVEPVAPEPVAPEPVAPEPIPPKAPAKPISPKPVSPKPVPPKTVPPKAPVKPVETKVPPKPVPPKAPPKPLPPKPTKPQ